MYMTHKKGMAFFRGALVLGARVRRRLFGGLLSGGANVRDSIISLTVKASGGCAKPSLIITHSCNRPAVCRDGSSSLRSGLTYYRRPTEH